MKRTTRRAPTPERHGPPVFWPEEKPWPLPSLVTLPRFLSERRTLASNAPEMWRTHVPTYINDCQLLTDKGILCGRGPSGHGWRWPLPSSSSSSSTSSTPASVIDCSHECLAHDCRSWVSYWLHRLPTRVEVSLNVPGVAPVFVTVTRIEFRDRSRSESIFRWNPVGDQTWPYWMQTNRVTGKGEFIESDNLAEILCNILKDPARSFTIDVIFDESATIPPEVLTKIDVSKLQVRVRFPGLPDNAFFVKSSEWKVEVLKEIEPGKSWYIPLCSTVVPTLE